MDKNSVPHPARESYVRHKQQLLRQIILPIVFVTILGLSVVILSCFAITGEKSDLSLWADISMIWLIIPMMILFLILIGLMFGLVYGSSKLLKVTPRYTGLLQEYILWFYAEVAIVTQKITRPILSIRTWIDMISKRED